MPSPGIQGPVVHVGLPKTGTTSLQQNLFKRHSEIAYIGKPATSEAGDALLRHLAYFDSIEFDAAECRALYKDALAHTDGGVPLLSYEALAAPQGADRRLKAQHLAEVFPDGKVLITLRRHGDMLASRYFSDMRGAPWTGPYLSFEEWLEITWDAFRSRNDGPWRRLRYADVVDLFVEQFGRDRVLILLLEEFAEDPGAYGRQIAKFAGLDPEEASELLIRSRPRNTRQRTSLMTAKKLLSHIPHQFFPKLIYTHAFPKRSLRRSLVLQALEWGPKASVKFTEPWLEHLRSFAEPDLDRLSRVYGLPVREFRYPGPR